MQETDDALHIRDGWYPSYETWQVYFILDMAGILHTRHGRYTSYKTRQVYFIQDMAGTLHTRDGRYPSYKTWQVHFIQETADILSDLHLKCVLTSPKIIGYTETKV